MNLPKLPPIRVGLLNVNWTNGSRVKPCNPIPFDIIADFDELSNYKINWINNETGLIKLQGDYNYLVFANTEFYFLEKSNIVDINKLVKVYILTKDHWQTYINNPDNSVKGSLAKTNNENILWAYIQHTKAATTEVNSQKILHVCETADCTTIGTWDRVDVQFFTKDKDVINQFGYKWRITKNGYNDFIEKLNRSYNFDNKEPNQIISYCKFHKRPDWQNNIAEILEDFLKNNLNKIHIAISTNLETLAPNLKKKLSYYYTDSSQIYHLTLEQQKDFTIVEGTKAPEKVITEFDLSQIKKIKLLDLNDLGDDKVLKEKHLFNKSLIEIVDSVNGEKGVEVDNTKWYLKAKMYGKNISYDTFKHLPIADKIYEENYVLNVSLLVKLNLWLSGTYNKHNLSFSNSYVPAFYYPFWYDSITTNETLKKKIEPYNTEVGYLLNNINNYHSTLKKDIPNRHVYNGEDIYVTTGIILNPKYLTCNLVYKLSDNSEVDSREVSFAEVYKEQINESFWLTIWNSYLWWGELDRFFVGLAGEELADEIKYTEPICWVDDYGNIWDSAQLAKTGLKTNSDKLPQVDVKKVGTKDQEYMDALDVLQTRRNNIQLKEKVEIFQLNEGDIYWSSLAFGLFPYKDNRYVAREELNIDEPCLVVYTEKKYNLTVEGVNYTSINSDFGFKIGLLNTHRHKRRSHNINNLIINKTKYTHIHYIKPMLMNIPSLKTDNEKRKKVINDLFKYMRRRDNTLGFKQHIVLTFDYYRWNIGQGTYIQNVDYETYWPRNEDGGWLLIRKVEHHFDWLGVFTGQTTLHLEGGTRFVVIEPDHRFASIFRYQWFTDIGDYIYKNFSIGNLPDFHDKKVEGYTTWDTLEKLSNDIKKQGQTLLSHMLLESYKTLNNELTKDGKYTYINKTTLQDEKVWAFSLEKDGDVPYLILFIKWPKGREEPIIQIVLASDNIITSEKDKSYKLLNTPALINNDLVQVVNQQNTLYAYGQTFPIKTKMVTNTGIIDYRWTMHVKDIDDRQCFYLKMNFRGEGGDYLDPTITALRKEIKRTIGNESEFELARLNVDLIEASERRKFEMIQNKEKTRITHLNLRNQHEDLAWEQTWGLGASMLGAGINIGSSVATTFVNPAAGGLSLIGSIGGTMSGMINQIHQLNVKSRNLDQAETAVAIQIEQDKNRLNVTHKTEEMRERNRIYEMSNTYFNATPNNANLIEAYEQYETDGKSVVILHRVPTGNLLNMLRNFHKNYGFDIIVEDFELNNTSLEREEPQIYQFTRIDETSIDDLKSQEMIKNNFINGVYLINHDYQVKHLSFLQRKKQHEDNVAAVALRLKQIEDAKERARLSEIEAAAKGMKEAEKEYADLIKKTTKLEKEKKDLSKELEECKTELQSIEDVVAIYDEDITKEVEKQLEIEKENLKTISEEECEAKEAVHLERIKTLETEVKKSEKLRNTYNSLVDAHNAKVKEYDAKVKEFDTCRKQMENAEKQFQEIKQHWDNLANKIPGLAITSPKDYPKVVPETIKYIDKLITDLAAVEAKERECETRIKTPEEIAKEYKVEREQKIKGYVHKVCELLKLCDSNWKKLFKTLTSINNKNIYLRYYFAPTDYPYHYGKDLTLVDNNSEYTLRIITKDYFWNTDRKTVDLTFDKLTVSLKDITDFHIFKRAFVDIDTIYINGREDSWYGFKMVYTDRTGFNLYAQQVPGSIIFYITQIIDWLHEIVAISKNIDQLFITDNELIMSLYPELETNPQYKKIFRKFEFKVDDTATTL